MSKEPITQEGQESPKFWVRCKRARSQSAINLLNEWLPDESGYDEQVWPAARKAIAENALSLRGDYL